MVKVTTNCEAEPRACATAGCASVSLLSDAGKCILRAISESAYAFDSEKESARVAIYLSGKAEEGAKSAIRAKVAKYIKIDPDASFKIDVRVDGNDKARISFSRRNVYLSGRYVKLERHLSQTPWVIDGARKTSTSVEEEIARHIVPAFGSSEHKFHSAGREDVDVRMLGSGRPFVLEIVSPRQLPTSPEQIAAFQTTVNGASDESVVISNLKLSSKAEFEILQAGAADKRKRYACVVWSRRPLLRSDLRSLETTVADLEVKQQTPLRVLHRRSQLIRDKVVYECQCERINAHFFIMRIVTSAGMYVKEFVHGDLRRTSPSVAELLRTEATILQLDVVDLIM